MTNSAEQDVRDQDRRSIGHLMGLLLLRIMLVGAWIVLATYQGIYTLSQTGPSPENMTFSDRWFNYFHVAFYVFAGGLFVLGCYATINRLKSHQWAGNQSYPFRNPGKVIAAYFLAGAILGTLFFLEDRSTFLSSVFGGSLLLALLGYGFPWLHAAAKSVTGTLNILAQKNAHGGTGHWKTATKSALARFYLTLTSLTLSSFNKLALWTVRTFRFSKEQPCFQCPQEGCLRPIQENPRLVCAAPKCDKGTVRNFPLLATPLIAGCTVCDTLYPTWYTTKTLFELKAVTNVRNCRQDGCNNSVQISRSILIINFQPNTLPTILDAVNTVVHRKSAAANQPPLPWTHALENHQPYFPDVQEFDAVGLRTQAFETPNTNIQVSIIQNLEPAIWAGSYDSIIFLPSPVLDTVCELEAFLYQSIQACAIPMEGANWGTENAVPPPNFIKRVFKDPESNYFPGAHRAPMKTMAIWTRKDLQPRENYMKQDWKIVNTTSEIKKYIEGVME